MKQSTLKRKKGRSPWNARNKYGARAYVSPILDRKFDSTGEGKYAEHLYARQQNGEIRDLEFQVRWDCAIQGQRIGKRYMRIDFRYFDVQRGKVIWADFKGFPAPDWMMKADIWAVDGPGILQIVKANRSKAVPYTTTEIHPKLRQETREIDQ